jgi:hypothetical protein
LSDLRQYQIVHEPHRLNVRVVLQPSAPADALAQVRAALVAALEEAGAAPPPVEVAAVAAIEREPGLGAKLKQIKVA